VQAIPEAAVFLVPMRPALYQQATAPVLVPATNKTTAVLTSVPSIVPVTQQQKQKQHQNVIHNTKMD